MRTLKQIAADLRQAQKLIDTALRDINFLTGPENSREEVAPMGKNTMRDWSMARLAAAVFCPHRADWDDCPDCRH